MSIFNPSREEVRAFFATIWEKHENNQVLTPIEDTALKWVIQHPEYKEVLKNGGEMDFPVEGGQTNPFLHLSMHLALQEQVNIDSPPGIRGIYNELRIKLGEHDAMHLMMEALGQVIWEAQRNGTPLSNERYLELLHKLH